MHHLSPVRGLPASQSVGWTMRLKEPESIRRRRALKRLDRELSNGNFKAALSLVKQLQGKPGGLRGFGAAKQVPQRISYSDELKLGGMDMLLLGEIIDSIMQSIKHSIQFSFCEEFLQSDNHDSSLEDHLRCIQHEAGHFLVGYLLGVLPKRYIVPGVEALRQDEIAGGKVEFLGFEFLTEVDNANVVDKNFAKGKPRDAASRRKISSKTFNRFSCVILGGLTAEHLVFGHSEGLHSDVEKLDRTFKWMGFTENEAEAHVRWAAMNTVLILNRYHEARSRLAEAMASGRSVGFCIDTIESNLDGREMWASLTKLLPFEKREGLNWAQVVEGF